MWPRVNLGGIFHVPKVSYDVGARSCTGLDVLAVLSDLRTVTLVVAPGMESLDCELP